MSVTRSVISWLATQRSFTRAVGGTGMRLGFARRFIAPNNGAMGAGASNGRADGRTTR